MKNALFVLTAFCTLALILAGCGSFSLAADVTPPPDYVPPTIQPTLNTASLAPARALDPAAGEGIYLEKCAACHGDTGMGDGAQAGNLPVSVPALASPAESNSSRPLDWYQVVTEGRMDRYMPGFNSLDSQQKWDVLAYVYSLGVSPETLSEGQSIYETECISCHGPDGAGLKEKSIDWSSPASLMELSQQDIAGVIAGGQGADMPAFGERLNEEQRLAAAAYIRQLAFAPSTAAGQQAAETPSVQTSGSETPAVIKTSLPVSTEISAAATIQGVVTNASGGRVPSGLKAVLEGYESMQPALKLETEVAMDGSFMWEGVERLESRVYRVSVQYQGVTFSSQVIHGADMKAGETVSAPVKIYNTSHNTAGLRVDRMHVFFDFPSADKVQIVEMFLISNPGKNMIIPAADDQPLVKFALPAGYENLQFQDGVLGGRYLQTSDGFGDLAGITPGNASHQVLFAYELPYETAAAISFKLPLDVANAILMVPADGVNLQAGGLQEGGQRTLQEGTVKIYTAGSLPSGSTFEVKLSGRPGQTPMISTGSTPGLFIGGGVLVLALVGAAFWFMSRKESAALKSDANGLQEEETIDSVLDAIVALDDLHKAGQIPKAAYEERRAELKNRLRSLKED